MSDPDEITIIVHGAKGLKGKKPGRHKYSVIFGLGVVKFRTAVVKDATGNPDWNEETVANVGNILDQVFFIVTEKDDILGQISVPVTSIRGIKGAGKRQRLQPHKKCPNPEGEIVYQCYVSKYRAPGDHVPVIKNISYVPQDVRPQSAFQRLRKRMASPVPQRRAKIESKKDHKTGSLSTFNKKLSRSIQDLFSFGKLSTGDTINIDEEENSVPHKNKNSINKDKDKTTGKRRFSLNFLSVSNLEQAGQDPIITKVSPNTGPVDEPTRICIEGRNLGVGKSDIMSLTVAGCDCTDTLEYESSMRVYCTTHFWQVTKGAVVIDTISGGIGTLAGGFTFYEELDANENTSISTNKNPFETGNDGEDRVAAEPPFEFSIGGKEIRSGFNTVPRTRTSGCSEPSRSPPSPILTTPTGRYKKKHTRNASESTVVTTPQTPIERVSKEELQEKILQLQLDNAALKKDNVGMKAYIDRLVSKCMIHCPEALAQDDDEKSKLYVL